MNLPLLVVPASIEPSVPALIAGAGESAAWRFLEFFTVNIRNPNTRAAYTRAAGMFLRWCEDRAIAELRLIQPFHVAGYIEELQVRMSAPTVKQHLACLRMLFDWLVTGQVIPANPAHAVRGPRHSVSRGATTAVISSVEARELLDSMDATSVVGLRDRALVAVDGLHLRPCLGRRRPQRSRTTTRRTSAGGFASVRKTARSTRCPAITSLKPIWTPISMPPALEDDRKGATVPHGPIGRTGQLSNPPTSAAPMSGTWCSDVPATPSSKPRSAVTPSAQLESRTT